MSETPESRFADAFWAGNFENQKIVLAEPTWDDELTDEQVVALRAGDFDSEAMTTLMEFESEQVWYGVEYELQAAQLNRVLEIGDPDGLLDWDTIREDLEERLRDADTSDLTSALYRQTRPKLWLAVPGWAERGMEDLAEFNSDEDRIRQRWADLGVELSDRDAPMMTAMVAQSWSLPMVLFWAAPNDVPTKGRFKVTDAILWQGTTFNGDGCFSEDLYEVEVDAADVLLDSQAPGYGGNEVAGFYNWGEAEITKV